MNDPLQDERISAYLDGEMTAQERAEFERLLAGDPERRRLLDELRALSSTLGGLPKQALGDSFSQQVLRKAERVVLTRSAAGKPHEDGPAEGVAAETQHAPHVERPGEPVWPIGYSRRGWAWASLAVAAALVLMITFQHDPVTQLAKNQLVKKMEQPPAASRVMVERDNASGDLDTAEDEERVAGESPSPTAKPLMAAEEAVARSKGDDLLAPDQVMVVYVDIRARAASESRLNQVLISNKIVCDANAQYGMSTYQISQRKEMLQRDENEREGDNSKKLAIAPSASCGGGGGRDIARRGITENVLRDRQREPVDDSDGRASEDVVYVEASYGQIAQALKQLHDNAKDFPAVEVDPAPDVLAQQALVANSRGRATNRAATFDDGRLAAAAAPQLSASQLSMENEADLKEEPQPLKDGEEEGKGAKDRASQLARDADAAQSSVAQSSADQSSASDRASQKSAAAGTPLYVQLRDAFTVPTSVDAGGEESARATRVPAEQRAVAQQIVLNRRQQLQLKGNLRRSVDNIQQQQPADSRLGSRRSDRVQVLFILNVVEEPAAPAK